MKNPALTSIIFFFSVLFSVCNTVYGQVCFSSPTSYTTGNFCYSVLSDDFNGDGKNDIVATIANTGTNNVCVKLNNGTGGFLANTYFNAAYSPCGIISYDFNGDGKKDIATANQGAASISILLGNGSGGFSAATNYTVGLQPYSVVTGDFNSDGKIDLIAANSGSNYISRLTGNGLGGFSTATNFTLSSAAYHVTAGDFNGDGKLDIAASLAYINNNNVAVLINNGTGGFNAPIYFTANLTPIKIDNADFNNDGKRDLVVANEGSDNVSLLLGTGTGNFLAATNYSVGNAPVSLSINDYNADGKPDVAVTNSFGVSLLLNNGTGVFTNAVNFTSGIQPRCVYSADVNNDGKPDLMTANFSSNDVTVLLSLSGVAQPGSISGNISVPASSSQNYTVAPVAGATNYSWTLPAGWSGTSTTNTITAITGTTGGIISIIASNTCGISPSRTLAVNISSCVVPAQPSAISGNTSVAAGSTQTYSVAPVTTATAYVWTLPSGWSGSSTTNSISVTTGTNSGMMSVVAQNTCGSSSSSSALINVSATSNTCVVNTHDWLWVKSAGAQNTTNYVFDLATDNNGDVYVTGSFLTSTLNFGSTSLTNTGGSDMFLAKYDNNGNVLWAKSATGTSTSYEDSWAVETDANNNVIITGVFTGTTVTFGGTTLTCPNNGQNIFIVKYNSQGNLLWAKSIDFTNTLYIRDLATDAGGNIYLTGTYASGMTGITFGSITLSANSGANPFVVKYDSNGNAVWGKTATSNFANWAEGVAVDASGNVYLTGTYIANAGNPLSFGGLNFPSSNGNRNIYLLKLNSSGNGVWVKTGVQTTTGSPSDYGYDVAVDKNNNVAVVGYFTTPTLTFGSVVLNNSANVSGDIFAVKYNSAGTVLWANKAGGTGYDEGQKAIFDDAGNLYITGYFESKPASFGSTVISKANSFDPVLFVTKFDASGNFAWTKYADKTNANSGNQKTSGIDVDACGNIFVAADADNSTVFGNITLATGGIFVAKLGDSQVGIEELGSNDHLINVFPNPNTGHLSITTNGQTEITEALLLNAQGQTVMKLKEFTEMLDVSTQPAGIYFLQIKTSEGTIIKKIIKL